MHEEQFVDNVLEENITASLSRNLCTDHLISDVMRGTKLVVPMLHLVGLSPQSLKLNLVPRTQILGQFGPPKKRVNFDICNRRHKWVYCVY